MTNKTLPAGVWRDNEDAAKRWCPWAVNRCLDHIEKGNKRYQAQYLRAGYTVPDTACLGSQCACVREYRRPDNTSVQQDGTQPPPDGYYCGKAGKP